MGKKQKPAKTQKRTREEWHSLVMALLDHKRCTMWGKSMMSSLPHERREVAAHYADLIMRLDAEDFGD